MFLNLKTLSNGSAGTSQAASYAKVLVNAQRITTIEPTAVVDQGTGAAINAVRVSVGDENSDNDLLVKAFFGPQTAPVKTGGGGGNGTISVPVINQATTTVAETWTITATSATNWTVVGSVSGAKAAATTGTLYDNGFLSFTITAGGSPFGASDVFTVIVQSSLTKLLTHFEVQDYTGTPVFNPIFTGARTLAKHTRKINGGAATATSYVNPNRIALIRDNAAAGVTLSFVDGTITSQASSILIAVWATGLGARDIELTTTEGLSAGGASLFSVTPGGVETPITARAGGGQALATALSANKTFHHVTVCATGADSVALPLATGSGTIHIVKNSGVASCQAFGSGTDTIDAVATATGVAIGIGKTRLFVDSAAGLWQSLLGA